MSKIKNQDVYHIKLYEPPQANLCIALNWQVQLGGLASKIKHVTTKEFKSAAALVKTLSEN